jgi:hypothetical protein
MTFFKPVARTEAATIECPVCGATAELRTRVYRCPACGHGFRPFDGDSIAFHRDEYRNQFQRSKGEIEGGAVTQAIHDARAEIVAKRIQRIKPFLKRSFTALDVGAGAGTFALAIRDKVKSVDVTEVNEDLVAHCRDRGLPARSLSLDAIPDGESYDVVFAWHVLEHIPDARAAAAKLKSLFRRYLVLEIPVARGAPERFDGHYHYFSDDSFQRVFPDTVIRLYGNGVQAPARLMVLTHKYAVVREFMAEDSGESEAA